MLTKSYQSYYLQNTGSLWSEQDSNQEFLRCVEKMRAQRIIRVIPIYDE